MKIGVLGKISKIKTSEVVDSLCSRLKDCGYETAVFTKPSEIENVDVVLVLGGDGAILHSAIYAAKKNIKIIGINYGNLGFLTEYEKTETDNVIDLLHQISENTCRVIKRSILELTIGDSKYYALNEIALQRDYGLYSSSSTQILKLEIQSEEGTDVISGDGILVCTPTGSTAYSLSAGGAILTPEVPVFMLTPICAFSMRNRPVVFEDSQEFIIKSVKGKAVVLLDGKALTELNENVEVKIRKAPFTANFPVKKVSTFLEKIRNKLIN